MFLNILLVIFDFKLCVVAGQGEPWFSLFVYVEFISIYTK